MAKKNIPPEEENQSNQPVDPTPERRSPSAPPGDDGDLQALMTQVAALQVKVDEFDFEQFAKDVRFELEGWMDEIRHLIRELENQMQADRKSFKDLKDLLAKAEALIAKIPVTGDLVKEVLAALGSWQGQINADLAALRDLVKSEIGQLAAGLEELKNRLAGIDFDKLRPEAIRQQVLDALAGWQQQVAATMADLRAKMLQTETLLANLATKLEQTNSRLDALENRANAAENDIRAIQKAVTELRKMLEDIVANPQDPQLIRRIVAEILAAWQQQVETRLNAHEGDIAFLKNAFNEIKRRLDEILVTDPDPEAIINRVLDALKSWQQQVTSDLIALRDRLSASESAIAALQTGLAALAQKVNDIISNGGGNAEQVRRDLLAALAELEKRLSAEIEKLKIKAQGGEVGLRALQTALEALRQQIANDLANLKTKVDNGETSLAALRAALDDLARRLEEIAAKVPNPQDLVKFVFAALAGWQRQLEGKVGGLETKYTGLKTELDALAQRVNEIVLTGGSAEEVKKLILKALEAIEAKLSGLGTRVDGLDKALHDFILKVEKILNTNDNIEEVRKELLATINGLEQRLQAEIESLKARFGTGDTLIVTIQNNLRNLTVRIEEIANTVVNAAELKKQILAALADWQMQLVNDVSTLRAKVLSAEAALAALQTAVANLTTRVEELVLKGVDEEEIKRIIQKTLTLWQKHINAELQALNGKIEDGQSAVNLLQVALNRLNVRVEQIAKSGADADTVRQELLAALAELQQQLGGSITVLEGKVLDGKTAIEALQTALRDLGLRVDKIVLATTPEEIRELILDAIANWQKEIKAAVEAERLRNEEDRISLRQLRTEIEHLQKQIREIGEKPNVELIARQVLSLLQNWQAELTRRVDETSAQTTVLVARAGKLTVKIENLAEKLGLNEETVARLSAELAALTQRFNALPPIPTTQEAASQTLVILQTWQNGLEIIVNQIKIDNTQIHTYLNDLRDKLQALADKVNNLPPVPALTVIVNAVLDALTTWKAALEAKIQILISAQSQTDIRVGTLEGEIGETGVAVNDLTIKVNAADGLISGLDGRVGQAETALDASERRDEDLQKAIDDLQQQVDDWKPENDDDTAVRLARRCLTGRGIVCGFHIQHTPNFTLKITGGTGITSDGHLITTSGKLHFTHYREFEYTADYPYFIKKNKPLPVWELLLEKDNESQPGVRALTPQQARHLRQPFIQDKVVLVLLDSKNNAPERENATALRYLLMRQDDVADTLQAKGRLDRLTGAHPDEDEVWAETFSEADEKPNESDLYQTLRPELLLLEIDLPRFGFYQGKDCSPEDLDNTSFPNPLDLEALYETYDPIIHDAINDLSDQFGQLASLYHELLFPQVPVEEYKKTIHLLSAKWAAYQTYNERHPAAHKKHYIQYFYDWMRDLANAYHELRGELLQLMAVCCAHDHGPQSWHPRHLLLGLAWREEDYGLAAPLRHEFQQPPIYNGNAARLETCRLYLRRWMIMVREFYLPDYSDDESVNRFCKHEHPDPPPMDMLKITPGHFYDRPLSEQTIPYYYPVTQGTQSPHRFWHYRRAKTCTEDRLLSYHANDSQDSYTAYPATIRPLFYLLDAYDFYRIEGHIGKESTDASPYKDKVLNWVKKFNLDFDVLEMDVTKPLVISYPPGVVPPDFNTLIKEIQGAEHTAGVPKGGTFILVTEGGKVVWDLSLPYRCCEPEPRSMTVEATVSDCKDGIATVNAKVTATNPKGSSFKMFVDGNEVAGSPFPYSQPEVSFDVPSDDSNHSIEVLDVCSAQTTIKAPPDCTCSLQVEVPAADIRCAQGVAKVQVKVTATNPTSDNFRIFLDGVEMANSPFAYTIPAVSMDVPGDDREHTIEVRDSVNAACFARTTVKTPNCTCSMVVTTKTDNKCVNGIVKVQVAVAATNPASDNFRIFLDGAEVAGGPFAYTITAVPIDVPGNDREHAIVVQDEKNANCTAETSVKTPKCGCSMTVRAVPDLAPARELVTVVQVTVVVQNPQGDGFNLVLDGDPNKVVSPTSSFKYQVGGTTTVSIFVPIDGNTHTIVAQDNKDQTCIGTSQPFPV